MIDHQPQPLDVLSLPLVGERLIEASAGTGKTYTLAVLYLRLLLGLGGAAAYPRPLSVGEILVVTFTEAATEELRGRIRDNIHALRIACVRGESSEPILDCLLEQIVNRRAAANLLLAAERQMDEAAIYTIHGFCQRMLVHNAFESGILFEQTVVQDELPLRRQATADFWRRHCYPLPFVVAQAVSDEWSGPEALLADLMPYLHGEAPILRQQEIGDEPILVRHQQIIAGINQLKRCWLEASDLPREIIIASGVSKQSYSSRFLPQWLEQVSGWAAEETVCYQLPPALERFRQSVLLDKTKGDNPPLHPLFDLIDQFYAEPLTLRDLILARALSEVRQSIQQEKRQRAELGFDDLLSRLDQALERPGAERLAQGIRQRYPLAMVDEFQDTDPQQYRIFHRLYGGRQDCGLLLIGDPKQAIYAFRGADIFTYMQARQQVAAHYTMDINWRSSMAMVNAVNRLFERLPQPFIFSQIPFLPVNGAEHNKKLRFEFHGRSQPAMSFWLQDGEGVGSNDYQQLMARQCAAQIRDWLTAGQQQQALLVDAKGHKHPVVAADMAILVRTAKEATIVREALRAVGVPSVYLSNRESVFNTPEAKDLLWLLQAVLSPEKERALRSALASGLLGLNAEKIDTLNQNERDWDNLVAEFSGYRQHWLKYGILPMLQEVITVRGLAENLLAGEHGERRLTDIMHIGELLQEASLQLESEHALLRWLARQIDQQNSQIDSQQLRLESDRHLVKVITIHKSKGLEYPLVWLPFISHFRRQKNALYHDRSTFKSVLDLQRNDDALLLAEEERLAEDLRLLYVALTRSIYHCSIGIAPLFSGNRSRTEESDLHHSAIGHLIQRGVPASADMLATLLTKLAGDGVAVERVKEPSVELWQDESEDVSSLDARRFKRELRDNWQVTSYSGLQQQNYELLPYYELLPRFDLDVLGERVNEQTALLTQHTFPRGASSGTFLHGLLESLDFTQPLDQDWLIEQAQGFGLNEEWLPALENWLAAILSGPLNKQGLALNRIVTTDKQAELPFYLPIDALLQAPQLDALVKRYDPLSARCPALDFYQIRGMLKGFIDLVFCWQGRYYLLDFKSNWLGDNGLAYTQSAMEKAMCEHRYDLQYQLYTLALHRYLAHRLVDYDYQRHFGGVFYLFLRGMELNKIGQGIFYCRPALALVEGLDQLFSGGER